MLSSLSFALFDGCLAEYGSMEALARSCRELGLDGIEAIRGSLRGDVPLPPPGLAVGWHLVFWADWVDFWRGDEAALAKKFGSPEAAAEFYGGWGRAFFLGQYRRDLALAEQCGAKYAVLHVSDVSARECFTYKWEHTDAEVVAAAAELLDAMRGFGFKIPILVENQWWPGFRFTEPKITEALLEAAGENGGIMLDAGHLMSAETSLKTEEEAADFILEMLKKHGKTAEKVRGLHMHKSLSGAYARTHTGFLPPDFPGDLPGQFAASYAHVLQIDRHEPWTSPAARRVFERVSPEFLTHELAGATRLLRESSLKTQLLALARPAGTG